jgi:hypothetical protein
VIHIYLIKASYSHRYCYPVGWANASKWNKKNAVSKKEVERENGKTLDVEVRLISYSEHSAFPELIDFVQYLKPRKIIPTVFKDEADSCKIQDRFRHLIDSTRAKQEFFRSMEKLGQKTAPKKLESHCKKPIGKDRNEVKSVASLEEAGATQTGVPDKTDKAYESEIEVLGVKSSPRLSTEKPISDQPRSEDVASLVGMGSDGEAYDSEIEVLEVKSLPRLSTEKPVSDQPSSDDVASLVGMGFDGERARRCLLKCGGNLQHAIDALLLGGNDTQRSTSPKSTSSPRKKPRTSSQITNFFSKKTF